MDKWLGEPAGLADPPGPPGPAGCDVRQAARGRADRDGALR